MQLATGYGPSAKQLTAEGLFKIFCDCASTPVDLKTNPGERAKDLDCYSTVKLGELLSDAASYCNDGKGSGEIRCDEDLEKAKSQLKNHTSGALDKIDHLSGLLEPIKPSDLSVTSKAHYEVVKKLLQDWKRKLTAQKAKTTGLSKRAHVELLSAPPGGSAAAKKARSGRAPQVQQQVPSHNGGSMIGASAGSAGLPPGIPGLPSAIRKLTGRKRPCVPRWQ